jgi:phenylacetic acid degradation operon negative regulatory protein
VPIDARPVRPRSLIVTVYGAYARESGGWLSVAALVRLLGDLGVDETAVRSSVSRLKRRGLLLQERRDGAVGYVVSPQLGEILVAGDRRIFGPGRARLEDGWLLVVFSVPESERASRHRLRTGLAGLGLGTVAPGVWVGPASLVDDVRAALDRLGLASYAGLFAGSRLEHDEAAGAVTRWWDLDGLQAEHRAYVEQWAPVLTAWRRRRSVRPAAAFADYVGTLTAWRRLAYLDPGLPAEVLPPRWQGARAGQVFTGLREVLQDAAHAHVVEACRR